MSVGIAELEITVSNNFIFRFIFRFLFFNILLKNYKQ